MYNECECDDVNFYEHVLQYYKLLHLLNPEYCSEGNLLFPQLIGLKGKQMRKASIVFGKKMKVKHVNQMLNSIRKEMISDSDAAKQFWEKNKHMEQLKYFLKRIMFTTHTFRR